MNIQTDEQKEAVKAMIVAFGLPPEDVSSILIDPHRVTFTRNLRDENGQFYVIDRSLPRDEWTIAQVAVVFEPWARDDS